MRIFYPSNKIYGVIVIDESFFDVDIDLRIDAIRKMIYDIALRECNGNKARAALLLGTKRTTLFHAVKRLGVNDGTNFTGSSE